jgi:rare lipoprotein A (peptidoglycan hydrolase)
VKVKFLLIFLFSFFLQTSFVYGAGCNDTGKTHVGKTEKSQFPSRAVYGQYEKPAKGPLMKGSSGDCFIRTGEEYASVSCPDVKKTHLHTGGKRKGSENCAAPSFSKKRRPSYRRRVAPSVIVSARAHAGMKIPGPMLMKTSFYNLPGRKTASGEKFDPLARTAAAPRQFPFGTRLKLINPDTRAEIEVRVNDRPGPAVARNGRHLDISQAAAKSLGMESEGVKELQVEIVCIPGKVPCSKAST